MLTVLFELDGVVFAACSGTIQLSPDVRATAVIFEQTLLSVRCVVHDEPSGAVLVNAKTLAFVLEDPCCETYARALRTFA